MMKRIAPLAAMVTGLALSMPAASTTARSSDCVAALKARAEPLAQRVKRGDATAETPLLTVVTASFAFIGNVYKEGVRSPQAEELLRRAEKAQAQLPPAELAKLQDACQLEGERLLKDANYFERAFVDRAARKRIEKLRMR